MPLLIFAKVVEGIEYEDVLSCHADCFFSSFLIYMLLSETRAGYLGLFNFILARST